jgi:hypothetical protein
MTVSRLFQKLRRREPGARYTADALDASVLRVLQLKLAHGIVPLPETG